MFLSVQGKNLRKRAVYKIVNEQFEKVFNAAVVKKDFPETVELVATAFQGCNESFTYFLRITKNQRTVILVIQQVIHT